MNWCRGGAGGNAHFMAEVSPKNHPSAPLLFQKGPRFHKSRSPPKGGPEGMHKSAHSPVVVLFGVALRWPSRQPTRRTAQRNKTLWLFFPRANMCSKNLPLLPLKGVRVSFLWYETPEQQAPLFFGNRAQRCGEIRGGTPPRVIEKSQR